MRISALLMLTAILFFTASSKAINDPYDKDTLSSPLSSDDRYTGKVSVESYGVSFNAFVELFTGVSIVSSYKEKSEYNTHTGWTDVKESYNYTKPYIELKVGNRLLFGDQDEDVRLGLDANWGGFGGTMFNDFRFHFLNPGIIYARAYNEDTRLDLSFNVGPVVYMSGETDTQFMFRLTPGMRFRYKALSVGVEYKGAVSFMESNVHTHDFGLLVGVVY